MSRTIPDKMQLFEKMRRKQVIFSGQAFSSDPALGDWGFRPCKVEYE